MGEASLVAHVVKNLPAMQNRVWSLGLEDPLEKGMATHSIILAWRILWTEEPGRLQSIGSQRIRLDWSQFSMHKDIYCFIPFACTHAKSLQLGPTVFYPMDCSLPGSSVHRILPARILKWVAMPFSIIPFTYKTNNKFVRNRQVRDIKTLCSKWWGVPGKIMVSLTKFVQISQSQITHLQ